MLLLCVCGLFSLSRAAVRGDKKQRKMTVVPTVKKIKIHFRAITSVYAKKIRYAFAIYAFELGSVKKQKIDTVLKA